MTAEAVTGMTREYRAEMADRLRTAYIDRSMEFRGLGEVQAYLRGRGMAYCPEALVRYVDNEVRKRLEAEGYTPVNPTRRNDWLRSFTAPDVIKADSLVTRERTTASHRRRDLRQHENLAVSATDGQVRAKSRYELELEEAFDALRRAGATLATGIEEAIRAEAGAILSGE